jgi:hypothetical protein
LVLAGCSNTLEVERTLSPADARTFQPKLQPVSIARGDDTIPVPKGSMVEGNHIVVSGAAKVMELDEDGRVVTVRNEAGEWTEPGETITLQRNDRIVVRGTLNVGDRAPGGGTVVMKRQSGALWFGALSFGAAYLGAFIGGAVSNDDRSLLAPVVGPWLNLVNRPACVVDPSIGPNCVPDTFARFGSVFSGIFQGLGLIFIVAGLPSHADIEDPPEKDEKKDKATFQIVPLPGGLGIVGRF